MHEETFGEQVKRVLEKRGMTIKELAELIEERTNKKMSRQNLTQRLGRDNFQEQDMRLIAEVLGCSLRLSIMDDQEDMAEDAAPITEVHTPERTIRYINTDALREARKAAERKKECAEGVPAEVRFIKKVETDDDPIFHKEPGTTRQTEEKTPSPESPQPEEAPKEEMSPVEETAIAGILVRATPGKIGYVDIFDTETGHMETMTQWAFFGREEKRKRDEGDGYRPPTIWNK